MDKLSQFSAKMRDLLHKREQDSLSSFAQFSEYSKGRSLSSLDDTGDFRLCYHRDKDRIIHSKPFRRLKGKTQVFLFPIGDHYRTRLSHTLEVSQISRTVAKALSLNEDLTEAVALGHDLGHTPFGHFGERVLNSIVPGGFHHAVQSERIVRQMNVSIEVCDGVAKHSKGKGPVLDDNMSRYSLSLEGQIVRVADIIAYLNHDLDDSLRAGIICKDDIPKSVVEVLGSDSKCRLTNMIGDLIIETYAMMEKGFKGYSRRVYMSDSLIKAIGELREFMFEMVYECHSVSEDFDKIFEVCSSLYNFFIKNPDKLMRQMEVKEYDDIKMMAADYLSGMTDHYALHLYRQMFLPKGWASDEIVRFK